MHAPLVIVLAWIWFALTTASLAYVAWGVFRNAKSSSTTKWAWLLVVLYTGPFGILAYRASRRGSLARSIESMIHCLAGDATGIVLSAAITRALRLPMGIDAMLEYAAGFFVGLFVFQAVFMRHAHGGDYAEALKRSWFMEWVSMNAVMAGMIPVMMVLMTRDELAMDPASICFWATMSIGIVAGGLLALPVNVWLERASRPAIALATVGMLAMGVGAAIAFGEPSMR